MSDTSSDARLSGLYQELILDHYRRPRNKGKLDAPTSQANLRNPLCGDEVDVQVELRDGRVADVRFGGHGCSISQASASMMTELVKGKTPDEVHQLGEKFAAMDERHGNPRGVLIDVQQFIAIQQHVAQVHQRRFFGFG